MAKDAKKVTVEYLIEDSGVFMEFEGVVYHYTRTKPTVIPMELWARIAKVGLTEGITVANPAFRVIG